MKLYFNVAEKASVLSISGYPPLGHGFDICGVWNPEIHAAIGARNRALHKQ